MEKVVDSANAVQFHVKTESSLRASGHVTFEVTEQNIGNAINSGIFTAPIAGIYFFNLAASWEGAGGTVSLYKNSQNLGSLTKGDGDTPKTVICKLNVGDKMTVQFQKSNHRSNYDYGNVEYNGSSPQLSGVLLYEFK